MLSATVYDGKVTRLSWRFAGGDKTTEYVAYTNADFNYLRGTHSLEIDTHDFSFFMGIGDIPSANNPFPDESLPSTASFCRAQRVYLNAGRSSKLSGYSRHRSTTRPLRCQLAGA